MTPRPHLWFVCPQLGRPNQVWLQRQLDRITAFDVTVICWKDELDSNGARKQNWPVEVIAHPFNPVAGWRRRVGLMGRAATGNFFSGPKDEQRDLLSLAAQKRPDVILAQFGFTALRILPVAQKIGVPIVSHYHGRDLSVMLENRLYKTSLIRALPQIAAHVPVGQHQKNWLQSHGAEPDHIHVLPCGVPVEEFEPLTALDGPVRFLSVGRLVALKGLDIAIEAFAQAQLAEQGATIRIVGEDHGEGPRLAALADRLGVSKDVVFAGGQPSEKIREELAACSVFLHPSIEIGGAREGFGVAITEAAAMERPVIVSDSGGIPDQVIDEVTGFICPQKDVGCVARAMTRLAQNPALRIKMGKAGRANAIANFDTTSQVRKLEQVLLEAMTRQRRSDR